MVAGAAGRGMRRPARSDRRLDPHDPDPGRAALDRGRRAGDQPAPTHRDEHQVQVGHLLQQLEGGRALPGHHVVVVEGVDQVQAALGGQVGGEGLAVLAGHPHADDLGAVGPGGGHLGRVGPGRHHHHRPAPGLGRGQGDRLAVVAGRDRQHPGRPPGRVQGEQGVERPPGLERPDPLQVLGLGDHLAAELAVQQPGGDQRGAVDVAGDPGRRPLHVQDREGGGRPAHPAAAATALAARSASSALTS
jgi:hypothetical protein